MSRISTTLYCSAQLVLGTIIGLSPALWLTLANGHSAPALSTPLLAFAYVSFLALAFIATTCLMRSGQRGLGAGLILGLLLTTALYVSLLFQADGSFN
jgi:hypothetical protein